MEMFSIALLFLALFILFLIFADADISTHFYEVLYYYTPFGKLTVNQFDGKVIWITGASSGIGEALAYELASCNCKLVLSARREQLLENVKERCLTIKGCSREKSKDVLVLPFDILCLDSHVKMADKIIKQFGRIDVLVNNAGRSQIGLVDEITMDVYKGVVDLDLMAQISLTKAVLPHMKAQKGGHILTIGSVFGILGVPFLSGYCAAKFALMGFFSSLAMEVVNWNINVTMVCPGPVVTPVVQNSFGATLKSNFVGPPLKASRMVMPVDRCARLLHIALKSQLQEVWLIRQPMLFGLYMLQYLPNAKYLMKYLIKLRNKLYSI